MKVRINEVLEQCAKNGLASTMFFNKEKNRFEYEVIIGSKTGTGLLYEEDNKVILETRYQTKDEVTSYEDIANVAFRWFQNYKDREPFTSPDSTWCDYFLKQGWVKKVASIKYE
ncbi:MAG TPA: hypothetical protein V6C58_11810 [Allocoleopsis sp.]